MKYLRIRNWNKHQKIAGNRAPYVTIQTSILLDMEYMCLPDRERLCFLLLIVFAGTSSNKIPADPCHIQHLCHFDDHPDMELLMRYGFLEPWDKAKHSEMIENNEKKLKGQRDRQKKSRDKRSGHSNVTAMSHGETETETDKEHMSDSDESDVRLHKEKYTEARKAFKPRNKNDNQKRAWKAWKARIREGASPADLLLGIQRYSKRNIAEGTPLPKIMHMSTLLNADESWSQPWAATEKVPIDLDSVRRLVAEKNIDIPANSSLFEARKIIAKQTGMIA